MAQREDVTVVGLEGIADYGLLDTVVDHLRQDRDSIRIVSTVEYERLISKAARWGAPWLVNADASKIQAALEDFDARFPGHAHDLAYQVLRDDVAERVRTLENQRTHAGRREVIRETFFAYAGMPNLSSELSWNRSFLRYIGDASEVGPASEGRLLLAAANRGSLDPILDPLLLHALELDYAEHAPRRTQPTRGLPDERNVAASGLPGSYWPWGHVVRIVIELGPSAIAGAIAAQLLESCVRWARRWLQRRAPDEVTEVNVKIYAPNGRDVLHEVTVSRDLEPGEPPDNAGGDRTGP